MIKKNNKGISLISLTITIIVLMILAGTSITALQDGGILGETYKTVENLNNQNQNEINEVDNLIEVLNDLKQQP